MAYLKAYRDWRRTIREAYGSLDKFEDVHTVRYWATTATVEITEAMVVLKDLPKTDPAFVVFTEELHQWATALADLTGWLNERGLTG